MSATLAPTARSTEPAELSEPRAPRRTVARVYYGALSALCLFSIVLSTSIAVAGPTASLIPNPETASSLAVIVQELSYFTILSNILVMIVAFLLMRDPGRTGRVFSVVHFDAMIMITVTGLVYAIVLAPLWHPTGLSVVSNAGLHYLAPPLFILGFALFGPRPRFSFKILGQALIIPIAWLIYTLIHGAIIGWYPYPFIDVNALGYGQVAINVVAIVIGSLAIGAIYLAIGSLVGRVSDKHRDQQLGKSQTSDGYTVPDTIEGIDLRDKPSTTDDQRQVAGSTGR